MIVLNIVLSLLVLSPSALQAGENLSQSRSLKKVILKQNSVLRRNCLLDSIPVDQTNTQYMVRY